MFTNLQDQEAYFKLIQISLKNQFTSINTDLSEIFLAFATQDLSTQEIARLDTRRARLTNQRTNINRRLAVQRADLASVTYHLD